MAGGSSKIGTVVSALLLSMASQAYATMTLDSPTMPPGESSALATADEAPVSQNEDNLPLLYRAIVADGEEGPFASSYETTFSNTPAAPEEFAIKYEGGPTIDCNVCEILIENGEPFPADISSFNGTEPISAAGFFPSSADAISQVSIFGTVTDANGDGEGNGDGGPPAVPAPGTLFLLALGLLGLAYQAQRSARRGLRT